ncbi:hypothetical protein BS47DRAFT_1454702 [Hydnum rufescens UP504]|uniref:Uncharacterized protein n=1 Tax=Hydnum rufescens UP504 TaxID=1448309 RepID=A0A9P6DU96_9AGAM|nr:hypothetical protein BS47DRAFT_1454702 [Hydnum rufescens UP504]
MPEYDHQSTESSSPLVKLYPVQSKSLIGSSGATGHPPASEGSEGRVTSLDITGGETSEGLWMFDGVGTLDGVGPFDGTGRFDDAGVFDNMGAFDDARTFNDTGTFNDMGTFDDAETFDDTGMADDMGTFNNVGTFDDAGMFDDVGTFDDTGTSDDAGTFDDVGMLDNGETFEDPESLKGPGMFEAPGMSNSVAMSAGDVSEALVDSKVEGNTVQFLPGRWRCSGFYTSISTAAHPISMRTSQTYIIDRRTWFSKKMFRGSYTSLGGGRLVKL